jgi:hypothetical protein
MRKSTSISGTRHPHDLLAASTLEVPMSVLGQNQKLAQAFGFSEGDLEMNRQGRIAESQSKKISSSRRARKVSLIFYAAVMLLSLLVGLGVALSTFFNRGDNTTRYVIAAALALVALIFAGAAANYYLRTRDVLRGRISQREGVARMHTRAYVTAYGDIGYTTLGTGWFIKLDRHEFRVLSAEEYSGFEEGHKYRIYYVKNQPIDVILSAEAL